MGTLRYCDYQNNGDEPSEYTIPINIYELTHKNLKEWSKTKNIFSMIDWSEEPNQIFKKVEDLKMSNTLDINELSSFPYCESCGSEFTTQEDVDDLEYSWSTPNLDHFYCPDCKKCSISICTKEEGDDG